jgi:hypothetical protein
VKFAYARRGGPLLSWSGPSAPMQSRAADAKSLGAFWPTEQQSYNVMQIGGAVPSPRRGALRRYPYHRAFAGSDIPRPGSPEIIGAYEDPKPGAALIRLGEYSVASNPVGAAAGVACAYHGYKRTKSIGWTVAWLLLGYSFPVPSVAVAVVQGFGKKK